MSAIDKLKRERLTDALRAVLPGSLSARQIAAERLGPVLDEVEHAQGLQERQTLALERIAERQTEALENIATSLRALAWQHARAELDRLL